jgi:hypothetical protein
MYLALITPTQDIIPQGKRAACCYGLGGAQQHIIELTAQASIMDRCMGKHPSTIRVASIFPKVIVQKPACLFVG